MGVLNNSVNLQKSIKREFVLERLLKLGVTKTQTGANVHDCDYETLKYELVLASFREIDTHCDSGKWF